MAAASVTGLARGAIQQAADLKPIPLPPPIGRSERMQRLIRARALMQANDIGAIIVEPGASLDYFTGVQWWRSERLTAAVIPDPQKITACSSEPPTPSRMICRASSRNLVVWRPVPDDSVWVFA